MQNVDKDFCNSFVTCKKQKFNKLDKNKFYNRPLKILKEIQVFKNNKYI